MRLLSQTYAELAIPAPRDAASTLLISATWRVISPDYLRALGVRLLDGRLLSSADGASSPCAIVVSQSFARAFALLIAGTGLFGVLSHATVQRTPEIGVRIAMGAEPRAIVGLVMRQAGVLIGPVLGLAAGLGSALFAVEVLSSFVYGVTVRDTLSFIIAPALIGLVSVAACIVPARRATRIDPVRALRWHCPRRAADLERLPGRFGS